MARINSEIIFEISKYLGIPDLLSLAHVRSSGVVSRCSDSLPQSSSLAFRLSYLYSFWRPHEFDSSIGLAPF
ncbi:hypothetical protein M408DRAFT_136491 [Serendipita vermifera MAFF 305830]|uniref:Uncharacterized protein n=1 Tax=Serendipita vermifera MAFF 305830 TaxID=933852 RepID=A0A0C2WQT4_SERVB|nr:hypothetical protein M408DRAFT_136491 [Serendipita vermifera MAFF 305830]